jgi:probable addiction module antidote protein
MTLKTKKLDIAKHLKSDEDIRLFLEEMSTTGDAGDLLHAVNIAARAKGISDLAQKAGVTRASLYKSLAEKGNPRFETICNIIKAMGCKFVVTPA